MYCCRLLKALIEASENKKIEIPDWAILNTDNVEIKRYNDAENRKIVLTLEEKKPE